MDSQEKALELGKNEEVVNEEVVSQPVETEPQVETAENSEPEKAQAEEPTRVVYETKADVLHRLQDIAHREEIPHKDEVEYLKASFYKIHVAEREAKLKAYLDAGGDPEQYQYAPDEQEEAFKAEMGIIKEKRAKIFKEQEAEKQENLTKKLEIIDRC